MPNLPMITWPGKGKVQMRDIKELALAEKNYITEQRRYFHSHPELGGEEVETTKHWWKSWKRWVLRYRPFLILQAALVS